MSAVCRATLEAELKLLRDDCHRVALELQQRRLRVDRLQANFEVLSKKSRGAQDGEEPRSQAYYVIKSAQEREELQQSGDALDNANQQLQREVLCIANSLLNVLQMVHQLICNLVTATGSGIQCLYCGSLD